MIALPLQKSPTHICHAAISTGDESFHLQQPFVVVFSESVPEQFNAYYSGSETVLNTV